MASKRWVGMFVATCIATAGGAAVAAPPSRAAGTDVGALLYATHCVGCHTAQVHWRDGKRVADWAGLQAEVRRWQANVGLGWGDDDIVAVARYLNALHYHFPEAGRVAAGAARTLRTPGTPGTPGTPRSPG